MTWPLTDALIIDTDAKNEADDQYAIVHALLSPSLDVRGVIPAHFGTWRSDQSMIDSRAEVDLLLELMDLSRARSPWPTAPPSPSRTSTRRWTRRARG